MRQLLPQILESPISCLSLMVEASLAIPAGEAPVLEETPERFLRRRVDFRKDHRAWFYRYCCYPGESVEERNIRLGCGDPDLVKTVFVRRSDGLVRELPTLYDSRYFEYDGALTSLHPSVIARTEMNEISSPPHHRSDSRDSSSQVRSLGSPFRVESHGDNTLFPSLFSFINQKNESSMSSASVSEVSDPLQTIAPRQLMPFEDNPLTKVSPNDGLNRTLETID